MIICTSNILINFCFRQLNDLLKNEPAIRTFDEAEMSCRAIHWKWNVIQEIVDILKVPYQVTIVLQKENFKLSDFYACWIRMNRILTKMSTRPNETELAQYLLRKLSARENQFFGNKAISCALALDPRFCNKLTEDQTIIAQETLTQLWQRIKSVEEEANPSVDPQNSSDDDITIENTTLLMKYCDEQSDENNVVDIPDLLSSFRQTQHNIENETVSSFWNANKNKFAELHKLAEVIFAISPTPAVVERSFSVLSYVFSPRRNQLSTDMLESILMILLNPDLFYRVNEDDRKELESLK